MGLRILEAKDYKCCFYDSVDGMALGPVFPDRVIAQAFERWVLDCWNDLLARPDQRRLEPDLRVLGQGQLHSLFVQFCKENSAALEESG